MNGYSLSRIKRQFDKSPISFKSPEKKRNALPNSRFYIETPPYKSPPVKSPLSDKSPRPIPDRADPSYYDNLILHPKMPGFASDGIYSEPVLQRIDNNY